MGSVTVGMTSDFLFRYLYLFVDQLGFASRVKERGNSLFSHLYNYYYHYSPKRSIPSRHSRRLPPSSHIVQAIVDNRRSGPPLIRRIHRFLEILVQTRSANTGDYKSKNRHKLATGHTAPDQEWAENTLPHSIE